MRVERWIMVGSRLLWVAPAERKGHVRLSRSWQLTVALDQLRCALAALDDPPLLDGEHRYVEIDCGYGGFIRLVRSADGRGITYGDGRSSVTIQPGRFDAAALLAAAEQADGLPR